MDRAVRRLAGAGVPQRTALRPARAIRQGELYAQLQPFGDAGITGREPLVRTHPAHAGGIRAEGGYRPGVASRRDARVLERSRSARSPAGHGRADPARPRPRSPVRARPVADGLAFRRSGLGAQCAVHGPVRAHGRVPVSGSRDVLGRAAHPVRGDVRGVQARRRRAPARAAPRHDQAFTRN